MLWFAGILFSIALLKVLIFHLCRKDEVTRSLNSSRPLPQPASAPASAEEEYELALLRQKVQELTAECAALRRKNADMTQVLTYIREAAFLRPIP